MKFLLHHFLTCFFIVLIQLRLLQGPSYFWYYSAKQGERERERKGEKEREREREKERKRGREREKKRESMKFFGPRRALFMSTISSHFYFYPLPKCKLLCRVQARLHSAKVLL